jgi:predicted methyltransferase
MYGILDAQAGIVGSSEEAVGSKEQAAKIYNDRSEYDLVKKLEALKAKHDAMCEELTVKTANLEELLRQVHVIAHKIEVAEQRLAGEWVSDHPETAHTRIARVSDNIHSLNK